MKKLVLIALLVVLLVLGAIGCKAAPSPAAPAPATAPAKASPAAAPTITLKFSHTAPEQETSLQHLWCTKMKQLIEERSKGRVKVEVYPTAQLYKDSEALVAVSKGEIFATCTTTGEVGVWNEKVNIFDLYGLFTNRDQLKEFFKTDLVKTGILEPLEKKGLKVTMQVSFDYPIWTKKPIRAVADLKGLKIRVMPSKGYLAGMKSLGAEAINLPIAELYTAVQQGTVDGACSVRIGIYGRSIHEVLKYCLEDPPCVVGANCTVLSVAQLAKLPADIRELIEQANVETVKYCEETVFKAEEERVTKPLKAAGITFTQLPPDERTKFFQMTQGSWSDLEPVIGKDLLSTALKLRK